MGKRRYGSPGRPGKGAKAGRTLVYQIMACLVIVLLAIFAKKMDNAMAEKTLATVQTFMRKDYSNMEILDSAKSVFSQMKNLPEAVETAVTAGRKQMEYVEPTSEDALVMTMGGEGSYPGLRYSSEGELQVYACGGGTIISVSDSGSGLIRISHGGEVESQYAGCTSVYVEPLQKVKKGQLIASVAPGDQASLTFTMWKDGEAVNPADYIAF